MRTYPNSKVDRKCQQCGNTFSVFPSVIASGGGMFCSITCRGIAKRGERTERVERSCKACGKVIRARPAECKDGLFSYCSQTCYQASRSMNFDERFWGRIDRSAGPNSCWMWTAGKFTEGYGAIHFRNSLWKASRVAWILVNGEIPEGMWVIHRCDNPPCCNPAHLFLGTAADNTHDMVAKDRVCRTSGEARWSAKVTEEIVRDMRRRYIPRVVTLQQLADEYGVSFQLVSLIVNRKIWTHV